MNGLIYNGLIYNVKYHCKKNFFLCLNESPFKMMPTAFYFMFKALFVLYIFKLSSRLFSYAEKQLDRKAKGQNALHD